MFQARISGYGDTHLSRFFNRLNIHIFLIALFGLIAYSNTFHAPFVLDDHTSIRDNPVIKDLGTFLSGAGYAYNPRRFIGYLTIALNYSLGGLNVTGYHLVNLAIHIISGWLVYALVRLTLQTPFFAGARNEERGTSTSGFSNLEPRTSNLVPLLAALLFVVHPVQTQAVTYIIQRLASLTTMFFLAALLFYVWARLFQEAEKPAVGKAALCYLLALLAAVLAMKTKEIAFTLPVITVLYEFCFFKATTRKKLLFLVPVALTIIVIPLSMMHAEKPLGELLSDLNEMTNVDSAISRKDYLLTQFSVIVTYIRLLFLPVNQNLDYDYPVFHSLLTPRVLLSFLFLLALLGLAVWLYCRSGSQERGTRYEVLGSRNLGLPSRLEPRTSRLISFGILWFFITLSVESSVIPIIDTIFEHRLYLPSAGAFIAVAAALALVLRRYPAKTYVISAAVIIVVLSAATWKRNLVWGDEATLWEDVVKKSPLKHRPHNNLGMVYDAQGRLEEAIHEYETAIKLNPRHFRAHNNLGALYKNAGLFEEAFREYQAALNLNASFAEAYNNLGLLYAAQGRLDEAFSEFRNAIRLRPDYAEAHNNLGVAYKKYGRIEEAAREFKTAVRLDPGHALAARNLQSLSQ